MTNADNADTFDGRAELTIKEVADLLHVSRPTVMKQIKSGELPTFQVGRFRRIRRAHLEDFIERHTTYHFVPYTPKAPKESQMDKLKELIEKLMLGTVVRGLLWVFALLTAKYGLPAVGESEATEIAKYSVAAIFIVVAMFWSKKKDANLLATKPPK